MAWMAGCSAVGSAPALLSMRYLDKSPESLATRAIARLPPSVESGGKTALTTGMTTDRRIFDFPLCRGIMAGIEYPGIAKLVSRLVWDQETVRSSRTTRTKIPLKSWISEEFSYSLSIAAQTLRLSFSTYLFDKRRLNIVIFAELLYNNFNRLLHLRRFRLCVFYTS